MPSPRDASTPVVGAARSTVGGSFGALVGYFLAQQGLPAEVVGAGTALTVGLLGYVGKLVRTYFPGVLTPV